MKSVNEVGPHNVPLFQNLFARLNNPNLNLNQHLAKMYIGKEAHKCKFMVGIVNYFSLKNKDDNIHK